MFENPFNIMVECAKVDTVINTEQAIRESTIRDYYSSIPEVDEIDNFTAEMVTVEKIGNDYLVESYCIMPFVQSNGIGSLTEALDLVAEANGLPAKSVGLLLESQDSVTNTIDMAIASSKNSGKPAKKNNTLNKVNKIEVLADNLKSKGYTVKKKKSRVSIDEVDDDTGDAYEIDTGDDVNECGKK